MSTVETSSGDVVKVCAQGLVVGGDGDVDPTSVVPDELGTGVGCAIPRQDVGRIPPQMNTHDISGVVVIIDVQEGFSPSDELLSRMTRFCEPRMDDHMVIATRFVNHPDLPYYRSGWTEMVEGRDLSLLPEIKKVAHLGLDKSRYSALSGLMELDVDLQSAPIYVFGLDTEACVLHTAVDLYEAGHDVKVVGDLCDSGGGRAMHQAALGILRRSIGEDRVVNSDEI